MNQAFLDLSSQLCRTQDPVRQTPRETSNKLTYLSGEIARCRAPKMNDLQEDQSLHLHWNVSDQSLKGEQKCSIE